MNKPHQDDIAAICSHTGIDPAEYRSFDARSGSPATQGAEQKALSDTAISAPRSAYSRRKVISESLPLAFAKQEGGWRALRSVFETENSAAAQEREIAGRTLPAGSLSLLGACGGVGTTTILATVGRALSLRRERILLAENATQTMLPFYFGASDFVSGNYSFQPPRDSPDGPVLILSRDGREDDESRLWDSIRNGRRSIDRVLLDAARDPSSATREIVMTESLCLVILNPDLHSAVRVRSMEQAFRAHEEATGNPISSFYLLNKFERSLALHADIRNGLARQLGNRLLPFFIRRSDEVTQAVAEGLTVSEYAPDSGVTEDFQMLTDWLQASTVTFHPAMAVGGSH